MKQKLQPPAGLVESTPAGAVPLGSYATGENIEPWDMRANRARFTASRMGLQRLGQGTPCPDGSAVRHLFTTRRLLQQYRFANLTTTAAEGTVPAQIGTTWSLELEAPVLASSVDEEGLLWLLLENGAVHRVDRDKQTERVFVASAPFLFSLVPSIYADPFGGVIIAFSYALSVDGGATRFQRWAPSEEDEDAWELDFEEAQDPVVSRFWGADGEILAVGARPANGGLGAAYSAVLFGGTNTAAWSRRWERPAPDPVVDVAMTAQAVYGVAEPNLGRVDDVGEASVAWTPRELTNADERLYSGISTVREQTVRGLTAGTEIRTLQDARFDPSDFDDVLDDTRREFQYVGPSGLGTAWASLAGAYQSDVRPFLRDDRNTRGLEVEFRPAENGADIGARLWSLDHTATQRKVSATAKAPWQRSHIPAMFSASNAAHWSHTMLLRLSIEEFGGTAWRIVFAANGYRIWIRGTTAIEVRLDLPGAVSAATHTFTGQTEAYMCSTLVVLGHGANETTWRVNGAVKSSTLTFEARGPFDSRTFFGQPGFPESTQPFEQAHFGLKESWVILGDSTGGVVHEDAIALDDIERMEGFVCHAHACQDILDASHSYDASPPASAGDPDPAYDRAASFRSRDPFLFRLDRQTGRLRWVYFGESGSPAGNVGRGVAVGPEGELYTAGGYATGLPIQLSRLTDGGDTVTHEWTVTEIDGDGSDTASGMMKPLPDRCGGVLLPWRAFAAGPAVSKLARLKDDGTFDWQLALPDVRTLHLGGQFVDDSLLANGACQNEFLYVLRDSATPEVRRVELIGRARTGETKPREVEQIACCDSGVISRLVDGAWQPIPGAVFAAGQRPWSFEFFGNYYIGSPEQYLAWEPEFKRLRDWTPELGSTIPQRITVAVVWRSRILAVSERTPHIVFGSEMNSAVRWNTGADEAGAVEVTRAFAGTLASSGAVPHPITALMPANDDTCFIGTTRSVWRITGDPNNGGVLDDVLADEGVLDQWSWCRGEAGELYWLTTAMRVVSLRGAQMADLSSGAIDDRLLRINPSTYRTELCWDHRRKGFWLVAIPRSGFEGEIQHLFWSARSGGWHPSRFYGGAGRQITALSSLVTADEAGWGLALGCADGVVRIEHPEALDDDGVPIPWHVRVPLGSDADPFGSMVQTAEVVVARNGEPVRVRALASRVGEDEPQVGGEATAVPGRGDLLQLQTAGHLTWLELSGTGPAAVDSVTVDIHPWGID